MDNNPAQTTPTSQPTQPPSLPLAHPVAQAIPVAHPVAQAIPVAVQVFDATTHTTTHYCRHCGKPYVPSPNTRYTAQFFRCSECTDSKVFTQTLINSCVMM